MGRGAESFHISFATHKSGCNEYDKFMKRSEALDVKYQKTGFILANNYKRFKKLFKIS